MDRRKLTGYFFALFTVVVWGTTFIASKKLLAFYTPLQVMMLRFVLAYGFLWLLRPRRLHLQKGEGWFFVLMGLFSCSIYFFAENTALTCTSTSNVSILVSTAPIFTAVLAHFTTDEKIRRSTLLGILVAFAGVILVVFNGAFVLKLSPKGDLLAVLAAVVWSCYSVIMKRFNGRYDTILVTRRIILWGMLTALPLLALEGAPFPTAPLALPSVTLNILYLGLIGSAVCYVFWNEAFARLGVVSTNSFIYAVPFVTIVAAHLFLDEPISAGAVAGAVLITAGVVLSERRTSPASSPAEIPEVSPAEM